MFLSSSFSYVCLVHSDLMPISPLRRMMTVSTFVCWRDSCTCVSRTEFCEGFIGCVPNVLFGSSVCYSEEQIACACEHWQR